MAEKLARARAAGEVAVPVFVRAQALRGRLDGLLKAATPDDVIRLQAMLTETETRLAEFRVIPFDATAGGHFARVSKMKAVRNVGLADLLIAAIALAHDATLVTRNLKDFQPIPGLTVENWAD
jgi:tRNA(fMet)-specific endonuclease VapC